MSADLSIINLVLHASTLVQLVMLLLLGLSVMSWFVIFRKRQIMTSARAAAKQFESRFWSGGDLSQLYKELSVRSDRIRGMETIFHAGFKEFARLRPQGGIDPGEQPHDAARRELKEEIGTDRAVLIAESKNWLTYELPAELLGIAWQGQYRGQRQKWFLMRFTGEDSDINLAGGYPEFDAWKWVPTAALPTLAVSFKQRLYVDLLQEFGTLCNRLD